MQPVPKPLLETADFRTPGDFPVIVDWIRIEPNDRSEGIRAIDARVDGAAPVADREHALGPRPPGIVWIRSTTHQVVALDIGSEVGQKPADETDQPVARPETAVTDDAVHVAHG